MIYTSLLFREQDSNLCLQCTNLMALQPPRTGLRKKAWGDWKISLHPVVSLHNNTFLEISFPCTEELEKILIRMLWIACQWRSRWLQEMQSYNIKMHFIPITIISSSLHMHVSGFVYDSFWEKMYKIVSMLAVNKRHTTLDGIWQNTSNLLSSS